MPQPSTHLARHKCDDHGQVRGACARSGKILTHKCRQHSNSCQPTFASRRAGLRLRLELVLVDVQPASHLFHVATHLIGLTLQSLTLRSQAGNLGSQLRNLDGAAQ